MPSNRTEQSSFKSQPKRAVKRKGYYNFYTDLDWGKASNYDLCINSKIGIENSVKIIVSYVKERFNLD